MEYKAGDLVRYTLKNELGKIKCFNPYVPDTAFIWFHCGDTVAYTRLEIIELVLPVSWTKAVSHEELVNYLHTLNFSNDYAIEKIIEKKEEEF